MTDRELVELSAKAAGVEMAANPFNHGGPEGAALTSEHDFFNPLGDDGDALRLAAKLKIDIEWQSTGEFPEPFVEAYRRTPEGSCFCPMAHEDDYRRVIVEVAANIGKAMP